MSASVLQNQSEKIVQVSPSGDNVVPKPSASFVNTPYIQDLMSRAFAYLEVGYPVHFAGPAGTGKTTIAFHVAAQFDQPVSLIHGDDEFGSSDLIGRDSGYRKSKLVDNYIHSVTKTEENMNSVWVDNRLTTACQNGYTLIYDEFTRSRPEANNPFLSVLEEKILNLPKLRRGGDGYLTVHPNFKAIFTSNPEEYAGVHKTQDALLDRLITINLSHFDRDTEIQVAMAKSELAQVEVELVVDIVRELRTVGVNNNRPTIRASIAMARILANLGREARIDDPVFLSVCRDVLNIDTTKVTRDGKPLMTNVVDDVIKKVIGKRRPIVVGSKN
ncbi:gas vesicle protein GvpN [Desulforhopalus vacuolatus]|uniref:gas vesicle protein GvpN n=1 Tax=Desulforhopalus vacuolatus TaxID=40414 RepID=UPI0023DCFF0A|nr:gas vesicle protein GvpN [Desulforhopalus vacuolatus]